MKPQKRSDGRYMLIKQANCIKRTFYGDTSKDCIRQATQWNGSANTGISCSIAIDSWQANEIATRSKATREQYKYMLRYITPLIGSIRVTKVLPMNCQSVINKMHQQGLSDTTMKHARQVMYSFFEYERKMKKSIKDNPCQDITIPRTIAKRERRSATPEELEIIWEALSKSHYFYCYQFLLMTGLRPSEVCGIRYHSIKGNVLEINQTRTALETSSGKTKNATRKILLSAAMKDIIAEQKEYIIKLIGKPTEYIFPNYNGFPANSGLLANVWKRTIRPISNLTLYELRHTFVSLMIDRMPLKDLQEYIGHASSMETSTTYAHIFKAPKQTSEIIDEAISQYLPMSKNYVKSYVNDTENDTKKEAQ